MSIDEQLMTLFQSRVKVDFKVTFFSIASSNTLGFSVATGFSPEGTSTSGKIKVTFSSALVWR